MTLQYIYLFERPNQMTSEEFFILFLVSLIQHRGPTPAAGCETAISANIQYRQREAEGKAENEWYWFKVARAEKEKRNRDKWEGSSGQGKNLLSC